MSVRPTWSFIVSLPSGDMCGAVAVSAELEDDAVRQAYRAVESDPLLSAGLGPKPIFALRPRIQCDASRGTYPAHVCMRSHGHEGEHRVPSNGNNVLYWKD